MQSLAQAAVQYHSQGLCVIPCKPRDKAVALPAWEEYQTRQSTLAEINTWWASNSRYNIGLVHGVNNFCSIDIDHDSGALAELRARFNVLTSGRIEQSGGGQGYHVPLFVDALPDLGWDTSKNRAKGNKTWKTKYGDVNIRARWCQTVAPPSIHPTGGVYKFIQDGDIVRASNLSALMAWLDFLCPSPQRSTPANGNGNTDELKRHYPDLVSVFNSLGIVGDVQQDRGELRILGNGGLMINPDSQQWYSFRDEVGGDVFDAFGWVKFGAQWDRHNKIQFSEVARDMRQRAGIVSAAYKVALNNAPTPEPQAAPAPTPKEIPTPTQDELAQRWISQNPYTAYGMGEFRRYDKGIWSVVNKDAIMLEIMQVLIEAKADKVRPTSTLVANVTEVARLFVTRASSEWDKDKNVLVCANGALHIPTRTLAEHRPEHYATSGLAYNYNPQEKAPAWERFLDSTVPDTRDFLQEFAGYALTTDTAHEIAVWLYGPPGSGKSTFIAGLQTMLGARAGLLGLADIEKSRFALGQLPGKTLVVNTEQPSGYMQATYVLNSIISGEPITVERKYLDAVEITPRAKIAWAMNELPRISDAGNGLFRRVKVVRFENAIVTPDTELKDKIKSEGAGILNWALDGLARLDARGRFYIPPAVQNATEHFKVNNDVPRVFVSECCITGPDYKTSAGELYSSYRQWCIDSGHKPQSSTGLADEWLRLGFTRSRSAGKSVWHNVGLLAATQ